MKVDLYVQPGGEKLVKWAYSKLRALSNWRQAINLPVLTKTFELLDSTVLITSSEFGDKIRIFADPGLSGFVATVYLRRLSPSALGDLTSEASPALLPFNKTEWEYLGTEATFTTGKPVVQSKTRTPRSGTTEYFESGINLTFGSSGASLVGLGYFIHEYEIDDTEHTELLVLSTTGTFYKSVSGVRTALTASGTATSLDTFTVSDDGRTLLAYDTAGTAYRATIDMALDTPVTWTAVEDDDYGSTRLIIVNNSASGNPFVNAVSHDITASASYPLSRGITNEGADAVIWLDYARTHSLRYNTTHSSVSEGSGPVITTDTASGTRSTSNLETATIRLPDGTEKQFILSQENMAGNISFTAVNDSFTTVYSGGGGWTSDRYNKVNELHVIYADPVIGFVVYEYATNESYYTPVTTVFNGFYGLESVTVEYSLRTVTTREVGIILSGGITFTLASESTETVSPPVGTNPTSNGQAETVFGTNGTRAFFGGGATSDTTTPYIAEDSPVTFPAAARKNYEFGTGAGLSTRYSCTAKDAVNWLIGRTIQNADTGENDDFELYRGRSPTTQNPLYYSDVTAAYIAWLADNVIIPGIPGSGPDFELIALLEAFKATLDPSDPLIPLIDSFIAAELAKPVVEGTPDQPDETTAAELRSNPELFEIRASNLTFI